MPNEESQTLTEPSPHLRVPVTLQERHVVLDVLRPEQVVGHFRVLDDAVKVSQHVRLVLPLHPLQYLPQLLVHLVVDNPLCQYLRLDVSKSQMLLVEYALFTHLNILIPNDRFHCVV